MDWVRTFSNEEFECFESNSNAIQCRIEARKTEEGWNIYKSFFDKKGLNYTEEFVAPTYDKMIQIVKSLKKEKEPSVSQLRKLVLEKSRKAQVHIEREYKEYNVEKWKFGVNSDPLMNFVIVRCYDEVDLDIVIHESYKTQEQSIVNEIISILGFEGMEESINLNCYYFQKHITKTFEPKTSEPFEFL